MLSFEELSFEIEETKMLGLGFSIFTGKIYEILLSNKDTLNLTTISISKEKLVEEEICFICEDEKKVLYILQINKITLKGTIKKKSD